MTRRVVRVSELTLESTDGWVSPNDLALLDRPSDKAVLISECYFAASENSSGSRNTDSVYPVVKTQAERADGSAFRTRKSESEGESC